MTATFPDRAPEGLPDDTLELTPALDEHRNTVVTTWYQQLLGQKAMLQVALEDAESDPLKRQKHLENILTTTSGSILDRITPTLKEKILQTTDAAQIEQDITRLRKQVRNASEALARSNSSIWRAL
jgi:hypothetical protein